MDEKTNGMEKDTSLDGLDNMSGGAGDDEWEINIDKLLAQADMLVNNDMLPPMPEFEGESNKRPAEKAGERETGTEPVKQTENASDSGNGEASSKSPEMDSDLDEINNLLQQADLNEKIDDDMLALLESATENQADEDNPDEVFDIFAEGDTPLGDLPLSDSAGSEAPKQEQQEDDGEQRKKNPKKKKKKKEKKEKKPKEAADSQEGEKKPSFLSKIVSLFGGKEDFGEDDPDTAADENVKILNELNGDEGKKSSRSAKKSAKKKEDKKEKKNAKEAKQKPKAKAKKPAEPKKKKEKPVEKPAEKPVKILNGKSFAAIAGLCLSIIAGVMIVTTFIPEYADKQAVRRAVQEKDYETVYLLFYDKKLSTDETLLFNQARTIRQMERRLESYENNIALGREMEAVDSLMRGVEEYQELWEADEYQVRNEVDTIYLQICAILESNYGLSQAQAVEIACYDKVEYTKAMYKILGEDLSFGEEAVMPQEEQTSDAGSSGTEAGSEADEQFSGDDSTEGAGSEGVPLEDVLPEEEDILN